jgi:xanthine/uracil/vitamin C permease (AzgA family)
LQVRAHEPFTPAMLQEVEQFYFGSYMDHFAEPAFAAALAAIPFTFSWDGEQLNGLISYLLSRVLSGLMS